MRDSDIRLADVPVPKLWVWFFRSWAFTAWLVGITVIVIRNRCRSTQAAKQEHRAAERLGESAAQVVIETKAGARNLRRLTVVLALLTAVNTGFVVYSAVK